MNNIDSIIKRFKGRPDTEHHQAFVRVAVTVVLSALFYPVAIRTFNTFEQWAALLYFALIFSIPIWIYQQPGVVVTRRIFGIGLDCTALTLSIILNGEHWIIYYVLFMWICFANGFRYGSEYLLVSLIFSIAGLCLGSYYSIDFKNNLTFKLELVVSFLVLSLYINNLVKMLYEAIKNANQASEAKQQFLSTISHELRTPLHAITGLTGLISQSLKRQQQNPTQLKDLVNLVEIESSKMLDLVNDVLDFSKIESGKMDVVNTPLNLDEFIYSTSHAYSIQGQLKGLHFHTHVAANVPETINGDQHRLQQILSNLISNAIKFTEKGKVSLIVQCVKDSHGSNFIKWTVNDTGIGIPPEMLEKIFEGFTQADASTSRKYGGTGLGTTIAKQLVQLMGGDIGIVNLKGGGCSFWFTIPLQENPTPTAITPITYSLRPLLISSEDPTFGQQLISKCKGLSGSLISSEKQVADMLSQEHILAMGLIVQLCDKPLPREALIAIKRDIPVIVVAQNISAKTRSALIEDGVLTICDELDLVPRALRLAQRWDNESEPKVETPRNIEFSQKRILIADDNNTNLTILGHALQNAGHNVTTATDGEVALNLYVEKQFELDLIILDLNMPNMNGLEVTQFIRISEQSNKRIPVIILSADATKQAEERAINAGATAFLTKPLRLNTLNEKLADICDRFRKENGYVDIPREKTETPNQSIALDPALKILNLASLEELKTVSDKPEFVKNLIIEYLKDSGDLMSKLEHAIATEDYQLWADTAHAFAGSTDWLGLARLNKLLRVASKLEPQIFTDNGASIFKQIAVEYRSAKQSLQPLY